jgi:hypothetical protein
MKIELQNIKVSDLFDGYSDNQEGVGVGLLGDGAPPWHSWRRVCDGNHKTSVGQGVNHCVNCI